MLLENWKRAEKYREKNGRQIDCSYTPGLAKNMKEDKE